jgi:hypothetical protein
MPFDQLKERVDEIQDHAKSYLDSSLAYYKLWGFKVAMKSTTMILKFILISICLLIFLLFASIAGAFALSEVLNSYALGFLSVAGIYLIFAILLFLIKDKIVEGPILEKFSDIFFND